MFSNLKCGLKTSVISSPKPLLSPSGVQYSNCVFGGILGEPGEPVLLTQLQPSAWAWHASSWKHLVALHLIALVVLWSSKPHSPPGLRLLFSIFWPHPPSLPLPHCLPPAPSNPLSELQQSAPYHALLPSHSSSLPPLSLLPREEKESLSHPASHFPPSPNHLLPRQPPRSKPRELFSVEGRSSGPPGPPGAPFTQPAPWHHWGLCSDQGSCLLPCAKALMPTHASRCERHEQTCTHKLAGAPSQNVYSKCTHKQVCV